MKDYYKILGISRNASQVEIKAAYRALVRLYHPDKDPDQQEKFLEIRKAFEVLSSDFSRSQYNNRPGWSSKRYRYAGAMVNDHLVITHINNRSLYPGEIFKVTFTLLGIGSIVSVSGLGDFQQVKGPVVSNDFYIENGHSQFRTNFVYILRAVKPGYAQVGPVVAMVNGRMLRSSPMHVHVKGSTGVRTNIAPKSELTMMGAAILICFFAIFGVHILFSSQPQPLTNTAEKPVKSAFEKSLDYVSLKNGTSPYNHIFGEGIYDSLSHHMIRFKNGDYQDVVACLAKVENGEVIRNEYIKAGEVYEMKLIPNGEYFLRTFSGVDWNPELMEFDGKPMGGFNKYFTIKKFDMPEHMFVMKQYFENKELHFSVYEITLAPVEGGNMRGDVSSIGDLF